MELFEQIRRGHAAGETILQTGKETRSSDFNGPAHLIIDDEKNTPECHYEVGGFRDGRGANDWIGGAGFTDISEANAGIQIIIEQLDL